MQFFRQAEVEIREVDQDGDIGTALFGFSNEVMEAAVDRRKMGEYFENSNDRDVFGIDDSFASGGAHAIAAESEALDRTGRDDSQGLKQARTVHFPRGFAG